MAELVLFPLCEGCRGRATVRNIPQEVFDNQGSYVFFHSDCAIHNNSGVQYRLRTSPETSSAEDSDLSKMHEKIQRAARKAEERKVYRGTTDD